MKKQIIISEDNASGEYAFAIEVLTQMRKEEVGIMLLGGLVIYIEKLRLEVEESKNDPEIRKKYDTFFMAIHTLIDKAAKL